MNFSREDAGRDGADSSEEGDVSPTTGDKIVLGASIAGATLGACLAGPLGAIVGLRVGGSLAVAGVEQFEESDVENRVKNALHELRQNATMLRKTANLSQSSLYAIVDHLNLMTARYTAPLHRRVVFGVFNVGTVSGEPLGDGSAGETTKNWKKNILVKCRVLKTGDAWEILSTRRLTLTQFILLHEQFIAQIALDTPYENGINAKPTTANDDDDDDDDDGGGGGGDGDDDDDDEPIAVSTGVIDEMGFEHLEIVESPKRRKRKTRLSLDNAATATGKTTTGRSTLSPGYLSPPSPASPPNTPALTTPKALSLAAAETLTEVESALRDVVDGRWGSDGDRNIDARRETRDAVVEDADCEPVVAASGRLAEEELGAAGGGVDEDAPEDGSPSRPAKIDGDSRRGKDESASKGPRDICCICMESEAVVILPCYHSFCETCIDAWVASRRSTCPLCRGKLGARNDRWQVIEDLPLDFDVKTEIGKAMLHMAQNCGKSFDD